MEKKRSRNDDGNYYHERFDGHGRPKYQKRFFEKDL